NRNLPRSSQTAPRSSTASLAANLLHRAAFHQPHRPRRSNPHSARRTTAVYLPRFPPLEVFVRRPHSPRHRQQWAGIRKPSQNRTFLLVCGSLLKLELVLLWNGGPP